MRDIEFKPKTASGCLFHGDQTAEETINQVESEEENNWLENAIAKVWGG